MLQNRSARRRQRPVRQPLFRIENAGPEDVPRQFQVAVGVLEARKLVWSIPHSASSYVIIMLGKKKYRTTVRRNAVEPQYREYFVFDMYTSVRSLKANSLWLAVMEPRCCAPPRLLGEVCLDLATVWRQPHHQYLHKWAQLTLSRDPSAGVVGFLKVDISIMMQSEVYPVSPFGSIDRIDENLLLPKSLEQQRANYLITLHGGFGLANAGTCAGDRRHDKPPSTFVRITFCGLVANTAVQHRDHNPRYCEQVSLVEMFPNTDESVRLEVCSADSSLNKVLASTLLRLSEISHRGANGFVPTFGPSLLHMYGASSSGSSQDGAFHRGSLLVSLKTVVPYHEQSIRTTSVEPVTPLKLEHIWNVEDFCIFCPILEVSMLDRRIVGKYCGVAITSGELPCESTRHGEFSSMMSVIRSRKLHYTGSRDVIKNHSVYGHLHFGNSFPVLQLAKRLPDFRFRMYRNNMIRSIVANLEHDLEDVEKRLKHFDYSTPSELASLLTDAVNHAAGSIYKFLNITGYTNNDEMDQKEVTNQYNTELDRKQLALQIDELEKIYQQITHKVKGDTTMKAVVSTKTSKSNNNGSSGTRKQVKVLLSETKQLVQRLTCLLSKTPEGWPDITVWLLNSGSRVAYCRVPATSIIYSTTPEQSGKICARIHSLYMKPLKCLKQTHSPAADCFCIAGRVELLIWMGLYKELSAFQELLPDGYKLKVQDCDMALKAGTLLLECRMFLSRAELSPAADCHELTHTFVRVNTLNTLAESRMSEKITSPVWNQVLKINKIVHTSLHRVQRSPPDVVVEVCHTNLSGKTELAGRLRVKPTYGDKLNYEFAPRLHWHELLKGEEGIGRVLMSVQVLHIPETVLRTMNYGPVEETFYVSDVERRQQVEENQLEPLPEHLLPRPTTYKIDIYWWGLRDVSVAGSSGALLEIEELSMKSDFIVDKAPNCNFPNGRASRVFEGSLDEGFGPPLRITLYDRSTFGRTLPLSTSVVKNPSKYMVPWYTARDRADALKSTSVDFSYYYQALPHAYSSISFSQNGKKNPSANNDLDKKNTQQYKAKRSSWKKLLGKGEPEEEEYVLLPIVTERYDLPESQRIPPVDIDWWTKYYCSQKIYESELETQPEFSKFKDWCSTLKLYNGKKCGMPELDALLQCGYLKAGIAIYKWPPPSDAMAVSTNGLDLAQGYFSEHPSNAPAKFLIRVYVVKGLNLTAKDFTGKLDPYVVISCGDKHLGDRTAYVANSINPVFGKVYEFRCSLPEDYMLKVSLYDRDAMSRDELIGSTTLDLEDRIYSKHRARLPLSLGYYSAGVRKWRDVEKPSAILEKLCSANRLAPPSYPVPGTVLLNGLQFTHRGYDQRNPRLPDLKEQACLDSLHQWQTIPLCGHSLVPEHVETRSLYNPDKPHVAQGKIQMWLEIFPLDQGYRVPQPVDITPRKVQDYELKVTVWAISNTTQQGKQTPLHLKAWIGSERYEDILRSGSRTGTSNWQTIFHFQYQHTAGKLVKKEQGPFIEFEELTAPILNIQVSEENISQHDTNNSMPSLSLNLNALSGASLFEQHYSSRNEKERKINLFSTRSIRAWWPLVTPGLQAGDLNTSMIDLELILQPVDEAVLLPVIPIPEPKPLGRSSITGTNHFPFMEGLRRHVTLEYLLLAIILVITCSMLCVYMEIPRILSALID